MEFYSIGVYGSTEKEYFNKLTDNNVDVFCDIRQRRGVRGAKYSFVNSKRLQAKLNSLDIEYLHIKELAPTTEIRDLQKEADNLNKETKTKRNKLGEVFTIAYKNKVLNFFEFDSFINELVKIDAKRIVLFCVEEKHEACHRSIVTTKLHEIGYKITHL